MWHMNRNTTASSFCYLYLFSQVIQYTNYTLLLFVSNLYTRSPGWIDIGSTSQLGHYIHVHIKTYQTDISSEIMISCCVAASVSHQDRWPDWEDFSQYDTRHDQQACVSLGDNTLQVIQIWRRKFDWIHP
jgi:hypothetical protein